MLLAKFTEPLQLMLCEGVCFSAVFMRPGFLNCYLSKSYFKCLKIVLSIMLCMGTVSNLPGL